LFLLCFPLCRSVAVDIRLLDLGTLLLRDAVDFKELDVTSRALKASQSASSSSAAAAAQITPTKQQHHNGQHGALDTLSLRNNNNNSANNGGGGELSLLEEGEGRVWAQAAFAPRLARQRAQYNNSSKNKRGDVSKFSAWLTRSGCYRCCVGDYFSEDDEFEDFDPSVPEITEGDEGNDDDSNGNFGALVSHNGSSGRRGIAGSVDSRRVHKSRGRQFKRRGIPCLGCGRAARVAAEPLGEDGQPLARRRRRGGDDDEDGNNDDDGGHGTSAPADAVEWWGAVEQALAVTALAGNGRLQSLCLAGCDFTAGRFAAGRKSQRNNNSRNSNINSSSSGRNSGGNGAAARLLGASLRALPLLRLLDCRGAALDRAAKRTVADALLSALESRTSARAGSVAEGSDGREADNTTNGGGNDNDSDSSDDSVKEAARRARRKARKAAAAQAAAGGGSSPGGDGEGGSSSFDRGKRGTTSQEGLRYLAVEGWALLPGTSALDLDQRNLVDEDALLLAAALRCNTELQALR